MRHPLSFTQLYVPDVDHAIYHVNVAAMFLIWLHPVCDNTSGLACGTQFISKVQGYDCDEVCRGLFDLAGKMENFE